MIPDVLPAIVLDALTAEASSLHGEATAPASLTGLDAESELLFDLARTETFIELAEDLIGKAVVPIGIEYMARPGDITQPGPGR